MREKLGYPLCKTKWTVGEQLPLLEGKPACDYWKDRELREEGRAKEASVG